LHFKWALSSIHRERLAERLILVGKGTSFMSSVAQVTAGIEV
jgi:hypothetical protein